MRRYETIFITLADMPAEETEALIERYKSIVTSLEGSMIKIEKWGKRKLAYPIEKRKEGFYVLFDFGGESKIISEIERNFKIDDKIVRFQTVKIADSISQEEIEKELAESKKKAEEEARRREEAEARRKEEAETRKREAAAAAAVAPPPEEKVVEEVSTDVPPPEEKPDESVDGEAEQVEEKEEEGKVAPEAEPAEAEVEVEKKEGEE
ncbi:MAG: 30S ribosomal protein S6 [Deltaproteobacteria bacterium]|nr:30S ribosomal protein S6 [Deltaproteobacteria bacterium]MBN2845389.1 30S ribosomal protein S6 [Deltaproteobacteria bacterium]